MGDRWFGKKELAERPAVTSSDVVVASWWCCCAHPGVSMLIPVCYYDDNVMRQRYPQGFKGTDLPPVPKEQRRIWKAGGVADVSWVSVANHAGGYVCVRPTLQLRLLSTRGGCSLEAPSSSRTSASFLGMRWWRASHLHILADTDTSNLLIPPKVHVLVVPSRCRADRGML